MELSKPLQIAVQRAEPDRLLQVQISLIESEELANLRTKVAGDRKLRGHYLREKARITSEQLALLAPMISTLRERGMITQFDASSLGNSITLTGTPGALLTLATTSQGVLRSMTLDEKQVALPERDPQEPMDWTGTELKPKWIVLSDPKPIEANAELRSMVTEKGIYVVYSQNSDLLQSLITDGQSLWPTHIVK